MYNELLKQSTKSSFEVFEVLVKGQHVLFTREYLLGVAMCNAWRNNHPREKKIDVFLRGGRL